jgi:ketosteroid isomerase-like protein
MATEAVDDGMKRIGSPLFRWCSSLLLVAVLAWTAAGIALAQPRPSASDDANANRGDANANALFEQVASMDSKVFAAYNRCDLDAFASFLADDVEFYHDKGGLMRGKQAVVDAVKANICGKTRRDVVPGTMEVHRMDSFGALQMGSHWFCDMKLPACDGKSGGVGKYIHLWQHNGDTWKLTRVVSYDHAPAMK